MQWQRAAPPSGRHTPVEVSLSSRRAPEESRAAAGQQAHTQCSWPIKPVQLLHTGSWGHVVYMQRASNPNPTCAWNGVHCACQLACSTVCARDIPTANDVSSGCRAGRDSSVGVAIAACVGVVASSGGVVLAIADGIGCVARACGSCVVEIIRRSPLCEVGAICSCSVVRVGVDGTCRQHTYADVSRPRLKPAITLWHSRGLLGSLQQLGQTGFFHLLLAKQCCVS